MLKGDSVNDEGVDVAGSLGVDNWSWLVASHLDGRELFCQEGFNGFGLLGVDHQELHGLGVQQGLEKLTPHSFEVDKYMHVHTSTYQYILYTVPSLTKPFYFSYLTL